MLPPAVDVFHSSQVHGWWWLVTGPWSQQVSDLRAAENIYYGTVVFKVKKKKHIFVK